MATQAASSASAVELSALVQISAKASEQLSSVLDGTGMDFEADIPSLSGDLRLEDVLDHEAPTLDELGIESSLEHGSAAFSSELSSQPRHRVPDPSPPPVPLLGTGSSEGAILRQEVLKGVANQLSQAATHNEAGLPTVLAVGKYYAIGTSHGLILVFDSMEHLKCVLNPYQKGSTDVDFGTYGAVSALDINVDGTRLLCGHANGLITHWDLTSNKLLRFIDNAHPPGFGILNIKFTDDPTVAIFINTGGNIFIIKFKRTLGVRNWTAECFFSGCHGEALTMEPLCFENSANSSFKDMLIIAVATVTQVLILSLVPKLEGLISLNLRGKPRSLPQLAWHHVVIEHKSGSKSYTTTDPVLAAARGRKVHYIQYNNAKKSFRLLRKFEVQFDIASFRWINALTVVAMDTTERIHLISVKDDTEIEVLDLTHVELVYGSSFFKSLETGGNVSRALVVASEHACYNSVLSYQDQLLLLGLKAIHVVTIKPWKERLGRLVREGRLEEALHLSLELFEGKAKAVIGLSGTLKKRKEVIAEQVVDILHGYVELGVMVQKPNAGGEKELREHYKAIVQRAFDCCLRIKRQDLLFSTVYDTFSSEDDLSRALFLELLCEYVKEGHIHHIRTVVAKDFVDYYAQKGEYRLLEICIQQINPVCLDIHQVVEMCWSQRLYDAMIHVYNRGLHDYTTPLLELLLQLRATLKKGKPLPDEYQKVGYKLLVYIRCCLSGLAYPKGAIPEKDLQVAKTSVWKIILEPVNSHNPSDKTAYPHICTLLDFDTRESLNVLALAFEELNLDMSTESHPSDVPSRQDVVDILLDVMVHNQQHSFSPSQVGSLFTFLARQGAKHRSTLCIDEHVYDQVLEYITQSDEELVNEERQQALLELWHAGVLKKFDEGRLLVKAESARFYRLCELIYEKKRQFAKVLSCYLRDIPRQQQAFSYIHSVMNEDQYTEPDREEVTISVLDNLQVLISSDVRGTARLVLMDFPLELAEITDKLRSSPEVQFRFLQGIFDPKSLTKQEIAPPSHVVERYIDLLCRFQPEAVYTFLRSNDNYRVEEALDVCAKARLLDATAYLLERSGDTEGAFRLMLETLANETEALSDKCYESAARDQAASMEKVERILKALLQFCQRNSSRLDEKGRQAMWFPTFDKIHNLQRKFEKSLNSDLIDMYNRMIGEVLNSMLGYISLPDVLQKIIQDPSYQFKDIKELILGMLETYNYEETLLKTTNHILIHDVRGSLAHLCSLVQRGVSPSNSTCVICSRPPSGLADGSRDDVMIFTCGHLYHASCMGMSTGDPSSDIGLSCLICNKSAMPASKRAPLVKASEAGRSSARPPKVSQEEVRLEPIQKANLRRLRESFNTKPVKEVGGFELRLAPPRLSGLK